MAMHVLGLAICICGFGAQDEPAQTPRQKYDALLREYEAEEVAWSSNYGGGEKGDPQELLIARYRDWPGWTYAPRFIQFAEAHLDDSTALEALSWVVNQARAVGAGDLQLNPPFRRAWELLLQQHRFDSRQVIESCRSSFRYGSPWTEQFLRTALEQSKNREVRGLACFYLARVLSTRRTIRVDPWFDREPKSPFEALLRQRLDPAYTAYIRTTEVKTVDEEVNSLLERSIREFGEIPLQKGLQTGQPSKTIADLAREDLAGFREPHVGRQAPDIKGEDTSGKALTLGDYRGKTVILLFAAGWDDESRKFYARGRRLLEQFKGQSVALLGVDCDKDKERLRTAIKEGAITWPCWSDGGVGGPIATAWGVRKLPTVFVLDPDGVVRSIDPGEGLEDLVEKLVGQISAGRR
jgi:peroxiredoxin